MSRPKKYENKKRISLEVDAELHEFIIHAAKMQGKTIRDFIIEEVMLNVQGCFIICPKCEKPVLDQRTIIDDEINIRCHNINCGHTWHWKAD